MSTSDPQPPRRILIAGANGYMGSRLTERLLRRGHAVTAFVRASARGVPAGCSVVSGDCLDEACYTAAARGADTLVHLIGVAHPSPSKAALFETVDLASARTAARAATAASLRHIVYVSVARPAPVMLAYIEARRRAEEALSATTIPCTFLQPWYVVGPGHYWPLLMLPLYRLFEWLPATRETARRLGLLGINTMLNGLIHAIENPPSATRSWDVPTLRRLRLDADRLHQAGR
jgi:uncharacterized protein YbjT (DUF2867 family)